MKIHVCCGKGGVGKTTSAVSLGIFLTSRGERTTIIDYDGGHSVKNALGLQTELVSNTVVQVCQDLYLAIVEGVEYRSIDESKKSGEKLAGYLAQFKADQGIIPLADMVNCFFGVPADVPALQKFTTLVSLLVSMQKASMDNVIIDVEPTAGFERLLSNAHSTVRSLRNLKNQGKISLLALGAKWPDIAGYLKSEYIQNAEKYSAHIEMTVELLKQARYFLVSILEAEPVRQTFDVRKIIEKFGGQVCGYIANNVRNEERAEADNLTLLKRQGLPVVEISRMRELHGSDNQRRWAILTQMGQIIAQVL